MVNLQSRVECSGGKVHRKGSARVVVARQRDDGGLCCEIRRFHNSRVSNARLVEAPNKQRVPGAKNEGVRAGSSSKWPQHSKVMQKR